MRKNLCIVLILLICLVTTFSFAENESSTNENTSSTDLQTQREELKNKLEQANIDLENVQTDLSDNLQQVEKLDEKIATAEKQLQEQESEITELKKSINEKETELNEITEKYKNQKELFEKRIVALYEAGETQYLDIILKSRSLSEFLSTYYVISELAESDKNLLDDLGNKKKTINLSKQKLEKEKEELATIAETQTRLARTLQNTRKMRESFIEKLSDSEKELQSTIDEINEEYDNINRQILALAQQGINTEYIGGVLEWPVPGYTRVTSEYGMRLHPILGKYKLHTGVDIGAPIGANFIAVNDGIVLKAEMNSAYGNMVLIDHGGGITTLYAHGSAILVEVGQTVKKGDAVLKVGSTGLSTGAHAHFEVRINGITTNPLPYITTGLVPGTENSQNNDTNSIENE